MVTGLVVGVLVFFVTRGAWDFHEAATKRLRVLHNLYADALRSVNQLDQAIPRLAKLANRFAGPTPPTRADVPVYLVLDPTQLPIAWIDALADEESMCALRYFARWERIAALLVNYRDQFRTVFATTTTATAQDLEEFGSTVKLLHRAATQLRLYSLEICIRWFEAHHPLASRVPDVSAESEHRWQSVAQIREELLARRNELSAPRPDQPADDASAS